MRRQRQLLQVQGRKDRSPVRRSSWTWLSDSIDAGAVLCKRVVIRRGGRRGALIGGNGSEWRKEQNVDYDSLGKSGGGGGGKRGQVALVICPRWLVPGQG